MEVPKKLTVEDEIKTLYKMISLTQAHKSKKESLIAALSSEVSSLDEEITGYRRQLKMRLEQVAKAPLWDM